MGINADSKISAQASGAIDTNSLQPTSTNRSKAAEASGVHHQQNIMATITDDDDRLLARIGYTPVRTV